MITPSEPTICIALVLAAFAALSSTLHEQYSPGERLISLLLIGSDAELAAIAGAIGEYPAVMLAP
jgi:hypothetical protein